MANILSEWRCGLNHIKLLLTMNYMKDREAPLHQNGITLENTLWIKKQTIFINVKVCEFVLRKTAKSLLATFLAKTQLSFGVDSTWSTKLSKYSFLSFPTIPFPSLSSAFSLLPQEGTNTPSLEKELLPVSFTMNLKNISTGKNLVTDQ